MNKSFAMIIIFIPEFVWFFFLTNCFCDEYILTEPRNSPKTCGTARFPAVIATLKTDSFLNCLWRLHESIDLSRPHHVQVENVPDPGVEQADDIFCVLRQRRSVALTSIFIEANTSG